MSKSSQKLAQIQATLTVTPLSAAQLAAIAHDPLLTAIRKEHRACDHRIRRLTVETVLHAFWDHRDFAVGLCHAVLRPTRWHRGKRWRLDLGKAWLEREIGEVEAKLHAAHAVNNGRVLRRCAHGDDDFRAGGVVVPASAVGGSLSARVNVASGGTGEEPLSPGSFLHDAGEHRWRQRRTDGTWMRPICSEALTEKLLAAGKKPAIFKQEIASFDTSRPFFNDDRELIVDRGEVVFNTFDGWKLEPRPGRWPHIRRVLASVCGGDRNIYDYFLDWLALPLQKLRHEGRPYKTRTAVVFHGPQGSGKGTVENFMRGIYGEKYVVVMGQDALDGRFTSDIENALFVVANEVVSSTNRYAQTENKLKAWITDVNIPIEKKHKDPINAQSFFNILFTSNDDRPVVVPAGDRRYTVIKTSASQLPDWLTNAVYADLAGEKLELRAFLHHLLYRRIRNNVGRPMHTDARAEVQAATASSDAKFARALAREGWISLSRPWAEAQRPRFHGDTDHERVVVDHEGCPDRVRASRLFDVYLYWCRREGLRPVVSSKLGTTVKKQVPGAESTWKKVSGVGMQVWTGLPMQPSAPLVVDLPATPTPVCAAPAVDNPDFG